MIKNFEFLITLSSPSTKGYCANFLVEFRELLILLSKLFVLHFVYMVFFLLY